MSSLSYFQSVDNAFREFCFPRRCTKDRLIERFMHRYVNVMFTLYLVTYIIPSFLSIALSIETPY